MVVTQPPYEPAATDFTAPDASLLAAEAVRVGRLGVLAGARTQSVTVSPGTCPPH